MNEETCGLRIGYTGREKAGKLFRILFAGISVCLLSMPAAFAQVTESQGQTASGAYYTIAVPDVWQASDGLVIWNHGYQGYTQTEPEPNPSLGPLEDFVLEQGFALAASSFSQTGWAVFSSHIDNHQLYQKFVELHGTPEKLFIQGASMGGIVSLRDLEAGLLPKVDGSFLMCGAVGGSSNWYNAFDLRMIYEAVCDQVSGASLPTSNWHEQPSALSGELEFFDSLAQCVGIYPEELLSPTLADSIRSSAESERLNQILELSGVGKEFLLLDLGYAVFEIPNLLNHPGKLNGSRPFDNTGIDYGDEEINLLIQRSAALPSSRDLLLDNYTPSGNIGATKIVSIHTSRDGLVKVENQQALAQLLVSSQLTTAVVAEAEPSHCSFTDEEGLAAWNKLRGWVAGEAQPVAADLQQECLDNSSDAERCRFDGNFDIGDTLLAFPRTEAAAVLGSNSFDAATGIVTIESLRQPGDGLNYSVSLLPPAEESSLFTIGEIEASQLPSSWQHQAVFFPDESILYVPGMQIAPVEPNSESYNVYMRYGSENGVEGLQLLEYELSQP